MGRLFWKLFALIGLVQLVTVVAVSASFLMREPERHAPHGPPDHHAPPYGAPMPPGARPPHPDGPPPPPPEHFFFVPPQPLIGGLLASLVTAALLAWYLAKPIRSLRAAFHAAAGGDLQVRVAPTMGAGKDELSDLGRDFDAMVERLHALISGQRRLLHDVSHELRSPLARMQAAIGLASQQPARAAEAMERIELESARMDRLIGELLALARLQAGFTGAMNEDIDLRELMTVIVDDARFEAQAKQRSVVVDAQDEAVVRGSVELLRRAIENVVRNAIKYSFEGGTVRLAVRRNAAARSVVICVRDAGPGVPEPDLAAIFEPFFRGLPAGQDGHGLGLAIAKRIVVAHGGSIRAANEAAGGLRVEIELPLAAA